MGWLADKGTLACLLLEHVVATSFTIQLLPASKDDKAPPNHYNYHTVVYGISLSHKYPLNFVYKYRDFSLE